MAADIAGDFAAAGGVADVDRILEVELLDQLREIVGVGVHVVAVPRLARTAVAAAVMGDAAISVRRQEEHLVFEGIRGKRPTVAEDHRLPGAPVLVVNLRAVFGRERTHGAFSFAWVGMGRGIRPLGSCSHHRCRQACGSDSANAADQDPAARWEKDGRYG